MESQICAALTGPGLDQRQPRAPPKGEQAREHRGNTPPAGGSPQRDKGQEAPRPSPRPPTPAQSEPTATGPHQPETCPETRPDPRRGARHALERPEPPQPSAPTGRATAHHDDPAHGPRANSYTPGGGKTAGGHSGPPPPPQPGVKPQGDRGEQAPSPARSQTLHRRRQCPDHPRATQTTGRATATQQQGPSNHPA
ncbi:proline-rich protein 2-like [Plectropomus leopardus]|uniref:proline-rich protein 2-like n=1 Tax=Plectropomus leopardus TaxID=160734 RepID=UPI001C4C7CD3|nr:proline-rich protein 2-like [Plectropomus leopardus]